MATAFPFSAIVGQDELKRALTIAAVDRSVGGVLALGDRGAGKSTAIRALAELLPPTDKNGDAAPVVDLPLGATEDRVVGALDLEAALTRGEKKFEPGLLARAHGGFLYIDEVNLLEDHLVDVLLDVAASGENVVEREGLSVRHPAKFVLVGSGNPEEGELRPQLLDRFGLAVDVRTPRDVETRVEIVRRRDEFERDPEAFAKKWRRKDLAIRKQIDAARSRLHDVDAGDDALTRAAAICIALGTDGLRGELALTRAARALAALEGADAVSDAHLRETATMALRHRLRKDPLDESDAAARVARAVDEALGA
ncbi:MAG: ATP-binding protein [Parvularculaceae bacterium]